jgi:hypothetical protein
VDEQVVEVLTTPKKSVVRKKLTQKKSCDAMTLYELVYLFLFSTMYHFLCLDHVLLSMFGPCITIYVWTIYQFLCLDHVSVTVSIYVLLCHMFSLCGAVSMFSSYKFRL